MVEASLPQERQSALKYVDFEILESQLLKMWIYSSGAHCLISGHLFKSTGTASILPVLWNTEYDYFLMMCRQFYDFFFFF